MSVIARGNAKLFVGVGESGKSTVLRQMRITLAESSIMRDERKEYQQILFSNMLLAFETACEDMYARRLAFDRHTSIVSVTTLEGSEAKEN